MCSAQKLGVQTESTSVCWAPHNEENQVPWGDFHVPQQGPAPYILSLCFTWVCLNFCLLTFWHLQEHEIGIYLYSECRGVCSVQWPRMTAVGLRGTETCSVLCHQAAGKGSAIVSSTSCRFCVRLLWTCGISLTKYAYPNGSATYLALLVPPAGKTRLLLSFCELTLRPTSRAHVLPVQSAWEGNHAWGED